MYKDLTNSYCSVLFLIIFELFGMARLSTGQLRSADVRRPCPSPEPTPTKSTDYTWVFKLREPFYVSMGSPHLYRSYAEALLGHPAADQSELDQMNLRIAFRTYIIDTTGYEHKQFHQLCEPVKETLLSSLPDTTLVIANLAHVTCKPIAGSSGVNISSIPITTDILVWTDNKSAILMERCVSPGYGDWKLLTTDSKVSSKVKAIVLAKVTQLGLDTTGYKP